MTLPRKTSRVQISGLNTRQLYLPMTRNRRNSPKHQKNQVAKTIHPVYTEIREFSHFYPAEEYHKDYYARNPDVPYSQLIIAPKIEKVKKLIKKDGE